MVKFKWTCPKCQLEQTDEVDPVLGPFITCTCSQCGGSFDQSRVGTVEVADHD
jgi:hypothetical protein